MIAPAITGWLATRASGSYTVGLYFAAMVMGIGVVLLVLLKGIAKRDRALAMLATD
jgi:dipeptide/tripeptide permease